MSVSKKLRQIVKQRANERCEYCYDLEATAYKAFVPDHIISRQHHGPTNEENLALACVPCNSEKGPNIGGIDPETRIFTPFFNPRTQQWADHFRIEGAEIIPISPEGRATKTIINFNDHERVAKREQLIMDGLYQVPQPQLDQQQERQADYDARRRIVKGPHTRSSAIMRQNQMSRDSRESTERKSERERE